jgi:ubiquinone/menaquinone biosynthesis C-methylase UbiE
MIQRILEPEIMDTAQEAEDYDAMDHREVNSRFVGDFASFATAAPRPIRNALDVGTGTARIPILLCRRFPAMRFVASDLSGEMLAIGERNAAIWDLRERIQFAHDDAKRMRFADDSFDAVISNTILHHLPDIARALAEMWRVLAPGGVLFVRDLARPATLAEVDELVRKHGGEVAGAGHDSRERHERQTALFRASLCASLTIGELSTIVLAMGLPVDAARMTSDRHCTIACVK